MRAWLTLESHLHGLAFFVEVDISNVAAVEGQVLLPHCIGVERLVHPVTDGLAIGWNTTS